MARVQPGPDEALTSDEITSTEVPAETPAAKPRNAFAELMKPKVPKPPAMPSQPLHKRIFKDRDGLGAYIAHPTSYPSNVVLYHDDTFVVINDMYPKSSVHTLLLPRADTHNLSHPLDVFNDALFLAQVKTEVEKLKQHVAKELQRKFGKYSAQDSAREAVLNGEVEPAVGEDGKPQLPPGRDWAKEVLVGIHAGPSMNHLHVHVLSREMYSERMKHRKHYNSFQTPFLVDIADFPLEQDDPRRHNRREFLERDLKCWRCGKNFRRQFAKLKAHLEEEFEEWKKE